jgi:hypothetical protein
MLINSIELDIFSEEEIKYNSSILKKIGLQLDD